MTDPEPTELEDDLAEDDGIPVGDDQPGEDAPIEAPMSG